MLHQLLQKSSISFTKISFFDVSGKQPLVFKHEDPTDEDVSAKYLEDDTSNPSSGTSFRSPVKEAEKNINAEGKTDAPLFQKTGKIEREEGEKEEEENLKAQNVSLENE